MTRSQRVRRMLDDVVYQENEEIICGSRLPSGQAVICRIMSLCKKAGPGQLQMSVEEACKIVSKELCEIWICMNVYPLHENSVTRKLRDLYDQFKTFCKQSESVKFNKTDGWWKNIRKFNDSMTTTAYDIRTKDAEYQRKLEEKYQVKMTANDDLFYNDNCHGTFKFTCCSTVSASWLKQKNRREKRQRSLEKKIENEQTLGEGTSVRRLSFSDEDSSCDSTTSEAAFDEIYSTPTDITSRPTTRQQTAEQISEEHLQKQKFPEVKIRKGRKQINEKVIRTTVQCLADYKVSVNDLMGIIVSVANGIFDQEWQLTTEDDEDEEERKHDESDETTMTAKRRRVNTDIDNDNVFPSRRTLMRYVEDASYMNLKMVAEVMLNKEDQVVTVGIDDTTKAAGRRLYDVKTDHITVAGPKESRRTFTTGYVENVSHSGQDAAAAYDMKLKILSVLSDTTVDEIKESIDFWITDRAGDCSIMLQHLGVEEDKRLKCNAHVILGADNAADKVFRDVEQSIGVEKLIEVKAGEKIFSSPSSSIHTLALIAIAKLLSPSHAAHSVSLYGDFKLWLDAKGLDSEGFMGFCANRFGRIAEISRQFLKNKDMIIEFFDSVVDENSNRLVLAVYTYIRNSWFFCCVEVYERLGNDLIFPLMDLLGIDHRGDKMDRNWHAVRDFYRMKIPELKTKQNECRGDSTGQERLYGAVLKEVIETVERQLADVPFFIGDTSIDETKLQYAPITNLGAEGEFAKLDNRIAISGGTTSVKCHGQKNIISTNRLLVDPSFQRLTTEDRTREWKWARTSDATEDAREIEANFLSTVKVTKKLALLKKEELKKKKAGKTLKILDECKLHGGPLTPDSLDCVNELTEKQLLAEIKFLRCTTAPDIRQMRRVKVDGAYKMQKFTTVELKQSIRNAIKPESVIALNVDRLLLSFLS